MVVGARLEVPPPAVVTVLAERAERLVRERERRMSRGVGRWPS